MPKQISQLERDRDVLARYFEEIGRDINLSENVRKMLRNAFVFGELCKELEIINGRKLFKEESDYE